MNVSHLHLPTYAEIGPADGLLPRAPDRPDDQGARSFLALLDQAVTPADPGQEAPTISQPPADPAARLREETPDLNSASDRQMRPDGSPPGPPPDAPGSAPRAPDGEPDAGQQAPTRAPAPEEEPARLSGPPETGAPTTRPPGGDGVAADKRGEPLLPLTYVPPGLARHAVGGNRPMAGLPPVHAAVVRHGPVQEPGRSAVALDPNQAKPAGPARDAGALRGEAAAKEAAPGPRAYALGRVESARSAAERAAPHESRPLAVPAIPKASASAAPPDDVGRGERSSQVLQELRAVLHERRQDDGRPSGGQKGGRRPDSAAARPSPAGRKPRAAEAPAERPASGPAARADEPGFELPRLGEGRWSKGAPGRTPGTNRPAAPPPVRDGMTPEQLFGWRGYIAESTGLSASAVQGAARQVAGRLHSQIVREARYIQRNGKSELTIRLHPPELGRMKVAIQMRNGKLDVRIRIEDPQLREALRSEVAGLDRTLREAQLELTRLEVADYQADRRDEGQGLTDQPASSAAEQGLAGPSRPEDDTRPQSWTVFTDTGGVDCLI